MYRVKHQSQMRRVDHRRKVECRGSHHLIGVLGADILGLTKVDRFSKLRGEPSVWSPGVNVEEALVSEVVLRNGAIAKAHVSGGWC